MTAANDRRAAYEALAASLRKFERLSSPPRHLLHPLVDGGIAWLDGLIRAQPHGRRATELRRLRWAEERRLARLESWTRGLTGRSERCWRAMADRLAIELEHAAEVAAVSASDVELVRARIRACHSLANGLVAERATN